jgi:hypothetical protein
MAPPLRGGGGDRSTYPADLTAIGDNTMPTTITVELSQTEAMALAQFLKRAGFSDYRSKSTSDEEAYDIQAAAVQVREALAKAGVEPR